MEEKNITISLYKNIQHMNEVLDVQHNFDIVYRVISFGGVEAGMYFIDGFCKDDVIQKLLQFFMEITPDKMPKDAHELSKQDLPYMEADYNDKWEEIIQSLLSGRDSKGVFSWKW